MTKLVSHLPIIFAIANDIQKDSTAWLMPPHSSSGPVKGFWHDWALPEMFGVETQPGISWCLGFLSNGDCWGIIIVTPNAGKGQTSCLLTKMGANK